MEICAAAMQLYKRGQLPWTPEGGMGVGAAHLGFFPAASVEIVFLHFRARAKDFIRDAIRSLVNCRQYAGGDGGPRSIYGTSQES